MDEQEDRAGEWLAVDLPAMQAADLIAQAVADRDPYYKDRPYPRVEDWANGRNDFARPFPDLPWFDRALPFDSCAAVVGPMDVGSGCRKPVIHDFPVPDVSPRAPSTPAGVRATPGACGVKRLDRLIVWAYSRLFPNGGWGR